MDPPAVKLEAESGESEGEGADGAADGLPANGAHEPNASLECTSSNRRRSKNEYRCSFCGMAFQSPGNGWHIWRDTNKTETCDWEK
ncbi:hypothetical protein M3Y99_01336100 [Aphelenchoides fujianensis]|nr:hypothetical protein M3Y99_01336100 [Aphelenchoides fujianensis]